MHSLWDQAKPLTRTLEETKLKRGQNGKKKRLIQAQEILCIAVLAEPGRSHMWGEGEEEEVVLGIA